MKVRESSKSSLFLLELMISIVFFALAAAGCVQVFAKAHMLSQEASRLDMETQDTLYTLQTASYLPDGTGGGNE